MAPTARLPPKKDVALALLEQSSMYIHLDPRADGVQVPTWFKKQPQLVLQVGLNMAVPIPDLQVDESGLSCTLSFNRSPFFCMIPWPAVYALVGEKGQAMVWPEDVPAEVAAQAPAQKQPERPHPHLRAVSDGESAPEPAKAGPTTAAPSPEARAKKPRARKATSAESPAPKRTSKAAGAKAKPKLATKKDEPEETSAAKKPAPAKADAPAGKASARPKVSVATTQADKPVAAPAATKTDASKPKRELPPYLRVVK